MPKQIPGAYQDILVFDISVHNTLTATSVDRLDHLGEEYLGKGLVKESLLADEVEEVLARSRPLQDDDERVVALKAVKQFYNVRTVSHSMEKTNFKWNFEAVYLFVKKNIVSQLFSRLGHSSKN